jgi:hypothetical protein
VKQPIWPTKAKARTDLSPSDFLGNRSFGPDRPVPPLEMTPAAKAAKTARWARIMTKWWITRSRAARKWEVVNFTGPAGRESRGIVDFMLIRKDHRPSAVARGDFFEIILIQVKGGRARRPGPEDVARLRLVADHYHARAVVLAEWVKGEKSAVLEARSFWNQRRRPR